MNLLYLDMCDDDGEWRCPECGYLHDVNHDANLTHNDHFDKAKDSVDIVRKRVPGEQVKCASCWCVFTLVDRGCHAG